MSNNAPRKKKANAKGATKKQSLLRSLPSVSHLLEHEEVRSWLESLPRTSVVTSVQAAVHATRRAILAGEQTEPIAIEELVELAEEELMERSTPSLRPVINATGIVLHTGLGRAPLCDAAIEAIVEAAAGYCSLEYDLKTGARGRRTDHIEELLTTITGAEAATVVNNNAAATLLILHTFAQGKQVIVSRGQLIEIGGSFRLPDIMGASGAILREVGTTNRTRLSDFQGAIDDQTAMLFRAHPSNYRVIGFTEDVEMDALAELAHKHKLIAVDDLGSGALFDLSRYGLPEEPSVERSLSGGADLVCFSGDKLLGGPQCGIIVGRPNLIEQIDTSPLMRTYRVDKMTLLALDATLRCYLDPEHAAQNVPTLSMLRATTEELAVLATRLSELLKAALPSEQFYVGSDFGYAGGGSMPGQEIQTVVVQWRPSSASTEEMADALRDGDIPVIARVRDDTLCFDLRTLREQDFEPLVASITAAVWDEEAADASQDDVGIEE
jgi:L-seryl-tRNA(Ser) seleniumtransferase